MRIHNSNDEIVNHIGEQLIDRQRTVTTVESCTGGGIAQALTAIPGSSVWFERGFITYSNEAKSELVGVSPFVLFEKGAVSVEVAEAMAEGGLAAAKSSYALSVTGIAGPGGGSVEKPVGTVCFGWAIKNQSTVTEQRLFDGDRTEIRMQSVRYSLQRFLELLSNQEN